MQWVTTGDQKIVAQQQTAAEEGQGGRIVELAPFRVLYEDGIKRLGAGSLGG